jgi:hypothetical protein
MRAYLKVVTILGKPQRCDLFFTKNKKAIVEQCKKDALKALEYCAFVHLFSMTVEEGKNMLSCLTDWEVVYIKHTYNTPDEMIEVFRNKPTDKQQGVILWAKNIQLY